MIRSSDVGRTLFQELPIFFNVIIFVSREKLFPLLIHIFENEIIIF